MITIKKATSASRSYGRGMDNYYVPATYKVFNGDVVVGYINGENKHQYDTSKGWTVCDATFHYIRGHFNFKDAKVFAIQHFS